MSNNKLKLIEELTEKIEKSWGTFHGLPALHEHVFTDIRRRASDVDYLGVGLRRSEVNEDGDTEIVSYHHNAGRQVLATVPEWADGMAEHTLNAQEDIDRLLTEIHRLHALVDLKNATALRSGLKKGRT